MPSPAACLAVALVLLGRAPAVGGHRVGEVRQVAGGARAVPGRSWRCRSWRSPARRSCGSRRRRPTTSRRRTSCPLRVCGLPAVTPWLDPTMTVRVNGVAASDCVPTTSDRPVGTDWNVRLTVRGSSRSVVLACRFDESVAVRVSSRYDGYSWSGAAKEPPATPVQVWTECVWQFDGQCWMTSAHDRRARGQGVALAVGGVAGEARRCRRPSRSAPAAGRVDDRRRQGVVDQDRAARGAGRERRVGHPQADGVGAGGRERDGRLRGRRVVVLAVVVEVPGVGQRRAFRIGRAGPVEVDEQRRRAGRRATRRSRRSAPGCREAYVTRWMLPPSKST